MTNFHLLVLRLKQQSESIIHKAICHAMTKFYEKDFVVYILLHVVGGSQMISINECAFNRWFC